MLASQIDGKSGCSTSRPSPCQCAWEKAEMIYVFGPLHPCRRPRSSWLLTLLWCSHLRECINGWKILSLPLYLPPPCLSSSCPSSPLLSVALPFIYIFLKSHLWFLVNNDCLVMLIPRVLSCFTVSGLLSLLGKQIYLLVCLPSLLFQSDCV